jgi:hypothetical protein
LELATSVIQDLAARLLLVTCPELQDVPRYPPGFLFEVAARVGVQVSLGLRRFGLLGVNEGEGVAHPARARVAATMLKLV